MSQRKDDSHEKVVSELFESTSPRMVFEPVSVIDDSNQPVHHLQNLVQVGQVDEFPKVRGFPIYKRLEHCNVQKQCECADSIKHRELVPRLHEIWSTHNGLMSSRTRRRYSPSRKLTCRAVQNAQHGCCRDILSHVG